VLWVFPSPANLDAEAAKAKFEEQKKQLTNELDRLLRLYEKLESEVAAKRELSDLIRLGMN